MSELDRLGWVVNRTYAIGGLGFGLRTTSHELGEWLDGALSRYRVEHEARPRYSILTPNGDGPGAFSKERYNILYRGTVAIARTPDMASLVRTLLSDMEGLLFDTRGDAIYSDMVAVSLGESTALIPSVLVGFLETTGRRRLASLGLSLPLETGTAIDPSTGMVVPVRPMLDVAEGALEALAEVIPSDGRDERWVVQEPRHVDVVCSISYGHELLNPISRGLALHRLAWHMSNLELLGQTALEGLLKVVKGARCFEMASDKPRNMLGALLDAFHSD